MNENMPQQDNGNFGWSILGCCIPIVGLVLYFLWKDQKPKTAKQAGIGALVNVITVSVIYFIFFLIGGMSTLF